MGASRWQKQHIYFQSIIWVASAVISLLLIIILVSLGFEIETAGVFFILVFVLLRVLLAFIFKNRFANSMVRILKMDYEEIERDFRMLFKNKSIRFYRKLGDDAYSYEFPGRNLNMTVQPHWLSIDMNQRPATKVTLRLLNEKNKEFAEMLANSIDQMVDQQANGSVKTRRN